MSFSPYGSSAGACPSTTESNDQQAGQALDEGEGRVFNLHGFLTVKTAIKSRLRLQTRPSKTRRNAAVWDGPL